MTFRLYWMDLLISMAQFFSFSDKGLGYPILLKEGMPMLTIEGLIAVISLYLTAFGLGYAIGSNKTQK